MSRIALSVLSLALLSLLIAACGNDSGQPAPQANAGLTDPRQAPTATPWAKPPDAIYVDALAPSASPGRATYVVKAGDTLSSIAQQFGIDLSELLRVNNISDPTLLAVGRELIIPGAQATATPTVGAGIPTSTPTPTPAAGGQTYTVQPGDYPEKIAQQFGVDVAELMRLNNITDPTKLFVGQLLQIPKPSSSPTPTPSPSPSPTPVR